MDRVQDYGLNGGADMMIKHHLKGRGPDTFDVIVYIESLITRIHDFDITTNDHKIQNKRTIDFTFYVSDSYTVTLFNID